ncbi:MAG: solute-binding protein [Syntrophaceae bacterium]|nr:solute-binding protein [Syntrophaceae bacterium]
MGKRLVCLLLGLLLLAPGPCWAKRSLILATTTSTQDSGLLDVLLPIFERQTGIFVKTIAVGSGQAMAMGARGEADVLLVHSPAAERKFMADGNGVARRLVMHNDFVIVGPPSDPAKIRGTRTAAEAFRKIAASGSLFTSRGDHSGTHAKEQEIWKAAGVPYEGRRWYQQTGLGMGQTLAVAAEKKTYVLTDRGTYMALKKSLGLDVLAEGDGILRNIYHVIEVSPGKWPRANFTGARAFADFLVSQEAQSVIKTFGVERFGTPLFSPDAGKKEEALGR